MTDNNQYYKRRVIERFKNNKALKTTLLGEPSADFKMLEMQDVKSCYWYQFTWNPLIDVDDEGQWKNSPAHQFKAKLILLLKECTNASFVYTIEPSRTGRYHIHGWIRINDVWNFYQYDIHKLNIYNGMIRDTPDEEFLEDNKKYDNWNDYCNKCKNHTPEEFIAQTVNLKQ